MSDQEVFKVKFETGYAGSGAKQAQEDLRRTAEVAGKAQDDLRQKTKEARAETDQFGSSLRGASLIWSGLGSLLGGGVAKGLAAVRAGFRLLHVTIAANPLTGWLAIVSSLVTLGLPKLIGWLSKSSEATRDSGEAAKEAAGKISGLEAEAKAAQSALEKVGEARFEGLKKDLDAINAFYDQLNAAAKQQLEYQRQMGDAALAVQLADLDAKEAAELEQQKGAPVAQAQTRQHYTRLRLEARQATARKNAETDVVAANNSLQNQWNQIADLEGRNAGLAAETPEQKAVREARVRLANSMQKIGIQSKEDKKLSRLAELRRRAPGSLSEDEQVEYNTLRRQQKSLMRKRDANPQFSADDIKKAAALADDSKIKKERMAVERERLRAADPNNRQQELARYQLPLMETALQKRLDARQFIADINALPDLDKAAESRSEKKPGPARGQRRADRKAAPRRGPAGFRPRRGSSAAKAA